MAATGSRPYPLPVGVLLLKTDHRKSLFHQLVGLDSGGRTNRRAEGSQPGRNFAWVGEVSAASGAVRDARFPPGGDGLMPALRGGCWPAEADEVHQRPVPAAARSGRRWVKAPAGGGGASSVREVRAARCSGCSQTLCESIGHPTCWNITRRIAVSDVSPKVLELLFLHLQARAVDFFFFFFGVPATHIET